jgi:probable phosphoglycerate mutase
VGERAEVVDALREWDYGEYEGVTTAEVRRTIPGWTVWTGPCPGGETADDVGARADTVLARAASVDGSVAVFSHGHFLRVLIARWLGLAPADGRLFALATGTLSALGHEREQPVLKRLNG